MLVTHINSVAVQMGLPYRKVRMGTDVTAHKQNTNVVQMVSLLHKEITLKVVLAHPANMAAVRTV